jgi:hypothetical protein
VVKGALGRQTVSLVGKLRGPLKGIFAETRAPPESAAHTLYLVRMDVSVRHLGGSDLSFFSGCRWGRRGGIPQTTLLAASGQSISLGEDMGLNAMIALDGSCIRSVLLNGGSLIYQVDPCSI